MFEYCYNILSYNSYEYYSMSPDIPWYKLNNVCIYLFTYLFFWTWLSYCFIEFRPPRVTLWFSSLRYTARTSPKILGLTIPIQPLGFVWYSKYWLQELFSIFRHITVLHSERGEPLSLWLSTKYIATGKIKYSKPIIMRTFI